MRILIIPIVAVLLSSCAVNPFVQPGTEFGIPFSKEPYTVFEGHLKGPEGQVYPIYDGILSGTIIRSSAGHLAYIVKDGEMERIVVDGKASDRYNEIGGATFSEDGLKHSYWLSNGTKFLPVINGNIKPNGYDRENVERNGTMLPILLSSYGEDYVYFVEKDGITYPVINDKPAERGHSNWGIVFLSFKWSPQGEGKYAFISKVGEGERMIIAGEEGPIFDKISYDSFKYTSDGLGYSYLAKKDESLMLIINGQVNELIGVISEDAVKISPDGKKYCYVEYSASGGRVIENGLPLGQYSSFPSITGNIEYSKNGDLIYVGCVDGLCNAYLNGAKFSSKNNVAEAGFINNSDDVYYLVKDDSKYSVLINNKVQSKFESTYKLVKHVYAPTEGEGYAYLTTNDSKYYYVVNGERYGPYDAPGTLITNQTEIDQAASDGAMTGLFVNLLTLGAAGVGVAGNFGGKIEPKRVLNVYFSDQGDHFAFIAQKNKKWYVVNNGVDEYEIRTVWRDGNQVKFSDDEMTYWAGVGKGLSWKTVKLP